MVSEKQMRKIPSNRIKILVKRSQADGEWPLLLPQAVGRSGCRFWLMLR